MLISPEEALEKYGPIVNGQWPRESEFCVKMLVHPTVAQCMINTVTGRPTKFIYCNRDIAPNLNQAFKNVANRALYLELQSFDGCYSVRDVRGAPGRISAHAYALAIDVNASSNRLRTRGAMSDALAQCFKDAGFKHGRDFDRCDPMHFTLGW